MTSIIGIHKKEELEIGIFEYKSRYEYIENPPILQQERDLRKHLKSR